MGFRHKLVGTQIYDRTVGANHRCQDFDNKQSDMAEFLREPRVWPVASQDFSLCEKKPPRFMRL
jgi:hypothetical protein